MSVGLLVVAAGPGSRLKRDVPKALVRVAGVPLLVRTVRRFECVDLVDGAVVVVPPEHRRDFEEIAKEAFPESSIQVVDGGAERQVSVAKGLAAIDEGTEWVAIHDAARPFVGAQAIRKAIEARYPGVQVKEVRTMIVRGKRRSQQTRRGRVTGRTASYKKALITLQPGSEQIDFFEEV